MAVQGNLLGSSDLTRFVQAAQGNRPKSLGQIAEERRKERVAAERDLLKFAADLRLKRMDLKDKIDQRALQTKIQEDAFELEKLDTLAQQSNRAAKLAIEQKRLESNRIADFSRAQNQAQRTRIDESYKKELLVLERKKNAATKLKQMQDNFTDAIKVKATNAVSPFGGSIDTFVDRKEANALFKVLFSGLTDQDFEDLNIDKKEFTFDNYFGNTFYGKVDGKGNGTAGMMGIGDAQSDASIMEIMQNQTFPSRNKATPSRNEAMLQSLDAGKYDFNK